MVTLSVVMGAGSEGDSQLSESESLLEVEVSRELEPQTDSAFWIPFNRTICGAQELEPSLELDS